MTLLFLKAADHNFKVVHSTQPQGNLTIDLWRGPLSDIGTLMTIYNRGHIQGQSRPGLYCEFMKSTQILAEHLALTLFHRRGALNLAI